MIGQKPRLGRPRVRAWDVDNAQEKYVLFALDEPAGVLAFSPNGRFLATICAENAAHLWDAATGQHLHRLSTTDDFEDATFSPDGRRFAAVSRNLVMMWDTASGQEVLTLRGAPQRSTDNGYNPRIAFSPDGQKLAATNWNYTISVWDATAWAEKTRADQRRAEEERAFDWHLGQAHASLSARDPYAFAFHRRRLQALQPPTAPLAGAREALGVHR